MKAFRIIREQAADETSKYRVQRRGWFFWYDIRVLKHVNLHGPSISTILRFDEYEEAADWINNHRRISEPLKKVVAEFLIN